MGLISRVSSRTYRMSNLLASGKLLKNRLKQVISTNIFNCFIAIGNAPQASSQSMISSYHFSQNQKSLLGTKNSILTNRHRVCILPRQFWEGWEVLDTLKNGQQL